MQKTFFKAPSHWKMAEAEQYAISKGYETKWIDGKLHIEEVYEECKFFIDIPDAKRVYYKGFRLPMMQWNGWEMPYFTKEVVQRITADYNRQEESETFVWDGNTLVINDKDADEPSVIEPEEITCNGQKYTVYSWAYLGWIWECK